VISRTTWVFAAIAVVAIGLRAFALFRMLEPPHTFHGDPEFYTKITAGLLEGRWADDVWIFPPGYPFFSLPLALLFGAGWGIVTASAFAGIALPLGLLFLARFVSVPERAALAALIIAVVPEAIFSTARALSEAPTLLLLVAMMVLFEASERAKTSRRRRLFAVAAGLAGGTCALSRPETLPCIPLLAAFGVVFPSHKKKRRSWESTAILVGSAIIVMAPYVTALHDRSGIWGLSLKPYFNIKKTLVQAGGETFVERRTRWDAYQREYLIRDGRFDARRIVEGVWTSKVTS
jgi:4-amino-4-deoxy-L-arabinose transferase-like glycosyltransferase